MSDCSGRNGLLQSASYFHPMLVFIVLIVAGLILLTLGAECLVRGSSSVALRFGVTPLVVGLTIVAFGTGSPEFAISIGSAINGNTAMAIGNVVGSNISNVMLILGIAAVIKPLNARAEIIRRETPIMVAVTLLFLLLVFDGSLSRIDGAILVIAAVAYTFLTYFLSRKKQLEVVEEEFEEAFEISKSGVWKDVILIIAGFALLVSGAYSLLSGAVEIAKHFGISDVVIGLTIIAVGTSLPELATSAVAAYKGEADVALGNAIGSNVLNILGVLGLTALILPIPLDGIKPTDLGVMLGSAVLLNLLLGRRFILSRPEGALLIVGYFVYLYTLLP